MNSNMALFIFTLLILIVIGVYLVLQSVKKKTRGIIKSSECDIFRCIKVTRHYYMRPTRYKCNII